MANFWRYPLFVNNKRGITNFFQGSAWPAIANRLFFGAALAVGTANGSSTQSATIAGSAGMSGSSAGTTTSGASIQGIVSGTASSLGSSSVSAILKAGVFGIATSSGQASGTGSIQASGRLISTTAGTSTQQGVIQGAASLSGASFGQAGHSTLIYGKAPLIGISIGSSSAVAQPPVSTLHGTSIGTCSVTGLIQNMTSMLGVAMGSSYAVGIAQQPQWQKLKFKSPILKFQEIPIVQNQGLLILYLDCGNVFNTWANAAIKYTKPNGEVGYWTDVEHRGTSIVYKVKIQDLDSPGIWHFQAYAERDGNPGFGAPVYLKVT